jgi:hypothetical protein
MDAGNVLSIARRLGVNPENPNKPRRRERWGSRCSPQPTEMLFVAPDAQNKKYLCAIGNSFAGSQVSSTPSALTS